MRKKRHQRQIPTLRETPSPLTLQSLEPRILLDSTGVWQELGFRGASGGGISYNDLPVHDLDCDAALDFNGQPIIAYEGPHDLTRATSVFVRRFTGFNWVEMGIGSAAGNGISDGAFATDPDIDADFDGIPWVAYTINSGSNNSEIYVKYFNGQSWVGIGGSDSGGGISGDGVYNEEPSVAVGIDGFPVVAYTAYDETGNDREIVVKKWTGFRWLELTNGLPFGATGGSVANLYGGGVSDDIFDSFSPSISLNNDNLPVVAWGSRAFGQDAEIYLRQWTGTQWVEVGPDSASGPPEKGGPDDALPSQGISNDNTTSIEPKLIFDQNNTPIVVWTDWDAYTDRDISATAGIFVKAYNDGTDAWEEFSPGSATDVGIATGLGWYQHPAVTVDSANRLMVAWADVDNTTGLSDAVLARYDAGAWQFLADGGPTPAQVSATGFVQYARTPIPFETPDGEAGLVFSNTIYGDMIRVDNLLAPQLADAEIYVQRYASDVDWDEMGRGSRALGGVDNLQSESWSVRIATADDGQPILAWLEGDTQHLYIRQYNPATEAWDDLPLPASTVISSATEIDLSSDPLILNNMDGRPALAATDGTDLEVWRLNDAGTAWDLLGGGPAYTATGVFGNAFISELTVQAGPNNSFAVAWRNFDPDEDTVEEFLTPTNISGLAYVPTELHGEGASDIYGLLWDDTTALWVDVGGTSASGQGISGIIATQAIPSGRVFPTPQPIRSYRNSVPEMRFANHPDLTLIATPPDANNPEGGGQFILTYTEGVFGVETEVTPFINQGLIAVEYVATGDTWSELVTISGLSFHGFLSIPEERPTLLRGDVWQVTSPTVTVGMQGQPFVAWAREGYSEDFFRGTPPGVVGTHLVTSWGDWELEQSTALGLQWSDFGDPVAGLEPGFNELGNSALDFGLSGNPFDEGRADAIHPVAAGNSSQFPTVTWESVSLDRPEGGYPNSTPLSTIPFRTEETWVVTPTNQYVIDTDLFFTSSSGAYPTVEDTEYDFDLRTEIDQVDPSQDIFTRRFTGWTAQTGEWEQMNTQSRRGPSGEFRSALGTEQEGVDQHWALGEYPAVAIAGDGQPIVAWTTDLDEPGNGFDYAGLDNTVYVRKWLHSAEIPVITVIEASGTPNDDILEFPNAIVGQMSPIQYFTVANNGAGSLTIDAMQNDGPFEVLFTVDQAADLAAGGIEVPRGGATTFQIVFQPDAYRFFSNVLQISSTDPDMPEYLVVLEGQGVSGATLEITETVGIDNDAVVPFGSVDVGFQKTHQVTLHNTGTESLIVSSNVVSYLPLFTIDPANIPGNDADDLTIDPGESLDLSITFSPLDDGSVTDGLIVRSNDTVNPFQVVALTGNQPSIIDVILVTDDPRDDVDADVSLNSVSWTRASAAVIDPELGYITGDVFRYVRDTAATQPVGPGKESRTQGDLVLREDGGNILVYDTVSGIERDLGSGVHPNFDGDRVVFAKDNGGNLDIIVYDLALDRVVSTLSVLPGVDDDYPDISGDWVVWRTDPDGTDDATTTTKDIWAKNIETGELQQLTYVDAPGYLWPAIDDKIVSWMDERFFYPQIFTYNVEDRIIRQITDSVSDKGPQIALTGNLIFWSDFRNENWDLFAYDLTLDDVDAREFQLTFSTHNELNPMALGNALVWQSNQPIDSSDTSYDYNIYLGTMPGEPEIMVTETAGTPNDDVVDYGAVLMGGYEDETVTVSNVGTDDLVVSAWTLGGDFAWAVDPEFPVTITQGQFHEFIARFTPSGLPEVVLDTLIVHNAEEPEGMNPYPVAFRGSGSEAPVPEDDTATVDEDSGQTAIDVLANDAPTWPDVAIDSVTQPADGVVVITGGGSGLTYQPDADYYNRDPSLSPPLPELDTFTYTVIDATGGTNFTGTATVTVTVNNLPDDPKANDDTALVLMDSGPNAIDVLTNDTYLPDPPETLTVTDIPVAPTNGTVVITGGGTGLTYEPDLGFTGVDTFEYEITDEDSLTDTAIVTVTVTQPDLTPTELLVFPDEIVAGNAVTVASDYGNIGPMPAGDFHIQYLLWQVGTGTPFEWGAAIAADGLAAGESRTDTRALTIPADLTGQFQVGIRVDSADEVPESDEDNNELFTDTLTVQPGADLTPTALTADATVAVGMAINIHSEQGNIGTWRAENFRADYYLSLDTTLSVASDVLLGSLDITLLDAGQSRSDDLQFTVPISMLDTLGDYYLIVFTDAGETVPEHDETNNILFADQQVTLTSPYDLTVDFVTAPTEGESGQTIDVSADVRNAGQLASEQVKAQYFLSRDETINLTDTPLGDPFDVDPLDPDETLTDARTLTVPRAAAGDYYVGLYVDTENALIEDNEANNWAAEEAFTVITSPKIIRFSKKMSYSDADGDLVKMFYSGPGWVEVELLNGETTGDDVRYLTIFGSTEKSKLKIKVNSQTTIRQINALSPIKQIIAPDVDLTGSGGNLNKIKNLTLAQIGSPDVQGDTHLYIDQTDDKLKVVLEDILADGGLYGGGTVKNFTADRISGGVVRFEKIENLKVGVLDEALVSSAGSINKATIKGAARDAYLLAGYDVGQDLAFGGGDDVLDDGNFGKLTVKGEYRRTIAGAGIGPLNPETQNWDLTPGQIIGAGRGTMGNVTLKHVPNLSGGRLFGLAADSGFDSIKVNGNRVSAGYELGDFSLLLV